MSDGARKAVVSQVFGRTAELTSPEWVNGCLVPEQTWLEPEPSMIDVGDEAYVWWSRTPNSPHSAVADQAVLLTHPGAANPITDEQMLVALRMMTSDAITVLDAVAVTDHDAHVTFQSREDAVVWKLLVPLPSSTALKPWLYSTPVTAADSTEMFKTFVEEEVLTGAMRAAEATDSAGLPLYTLQPYGFTRANRREHENLLEKSGPEGWHGRFVEGGALD